MALLPEMEKLRRRLEGLGYSRRTTAQERLLEELNNLDKHPGLQKSIAEGSFRSTHMTSPGDGTCSCCGRAL